MGNEIDYLEQFGTTSVSIVLKCFVCLPGWVKRKPSSLKCFCEVTWLWTCLQKYRFISSECVYKAQWGGGNMVINLQRIRCPMLPVCGVCHFSYSGEVQIDDISPLCQNGKNSMLWKCRIIVLKRFFLSPSVSWAVSGNVSGNLTLNWLCHISISSAQLFFFSCFGLEWEWLWV